MDHCWYAKYVCNPMVYVVCVCVFCKLGEGSLGWGGRVGLLFIVYGRMEILGG